MTTIREQAHNYGIKIRDLPANDQPANRLDNYGAGALNTQELLAIVIGGNHGLIDAGQLMKIASEKHGDVLSGIARMTVTELQEVEGIGKSTATWIKAAIELGRRVLVNYPDDRSTIRSPSDAANLLMPEMCTLEQEHLKVIMLDTRNRVIGVHTVYIGTINQSPVRPAEIFREAIRRNAAFIMVAHNHPSGDPTPSQEDMIATRNIVESGKSLGIEVLDHMIIGRQRWVSMRERGLGFN